MTALQYLHVSYQPLFFFGDSPFSVQTDCRLHSKKKPGDALEDKVLRPEIKASQLKATGSSQVMRIEELVMDTNGSNNLYRSLGYIQYTMHHKPLTTGTPLDMSLPQPRSASRQNACRRGLCTSMFVGGVLKYGFAS